MVGLLREHIAIQPLGLVHPTRAMVKQRNLKRLLGCQGRHFGGLHANRVASFGGTQLYAPRRRGG